MEDYKKKYEEALERMKSWARGEHPECFSEAQKTAEFIFPELKESEDEKIRKDILVVLENAATKFFKEEGKMPVWYDGAIAWLEKQGQKLQGKSALEAAKEVKIDNQNCTKPNDKVEPNFKVGDWVVQDNIGTYKIVEVCKSWYKVIDNQNNRYSIGFDQEHMCHLWSINDAKDGDVLVAPPVKHSEHSEQIFIFKEIKDREYVKNAIEYYCRCMDNEFAVNKCGFMGQSDDYFIPATKEQRNLLFQKMKEAGYKWENNQLEEISNKGFVDLGLPSGTLWAKCNLGAEKETDFGDFFQWGDTQGSPIVDEHQFNWDDYNLTKYNDLDNELVLDNEDDPVFAATNGTFKMPTKEQFQELIDNTYHEWTNIDGINGMKFVNKNDSTKYIFIPAAGDCSNGSRSDIGSWGYVWSASRSELNANSAWSMYFSADDVVGMDGDYYRCFGHSVRGVKNSQK